MSRETLPGNETAQVNVVFRVDINPKIGAGHFTRCSVLAREFVEQGYKVLMLLSSESKPHVPVLEKHNDLNIAYFDLHEEAADDSKDICSILSERVCSFNVLIVDGYHYSLSDIRQLKQACVQQQARLMMLDDVFDPSMACADIILNPLDGVQAERYAMLAPTAQLLLGKSYRLVQAAYLQGRQIPYSESSALVLCFGASDPFNITVPLLRLLIAQTDIGPIIVHTGAVYPYVGEVEKLASEAPTRVIYHHADADMSKTMNSARLFVSAAGGTSFELEAMAVPSVLVVVADNQMPSAQKHQANQWCEVYDMRKALNAVSSEHEQEACTHKSLKGLMSSIKSIWSDEKRLNEWHNRAASLEPVNGARETVNALQTSLGVKR